MDKFVFFRWGNSMLLAFTRRDKFEIQEFDVVPGKGAQSVIYNAGVDTDTPLGKGDIILLSGPPGVGKTLTAESGEKFLLICRDHLLIWCSS